MLTACRKECAYPYMAGLKRYLSEIHDYRLSDVGEVIFYVTPLDGCDYCVRENLLVLIRNNNKKVVPVLIDKSYNQQFTTLANEVTESYKVVLSDPANRIQRYQTGYLNPILLHIRNGRCVFYMEIPDTEIPKAEKYLKMTE